MNARLTWPVILAVVGGGVVGGTARGAVTLALSVELVQSSGSGGGGGGYALFPFLSDAAGYASGRVTSASGYFAGSTKGAGSWVFSDFGTFRTTVTSDAFTLLLDKGLPSERSYAFAIDLSNLTPSHLPTTQITYPANGATGVPAFPTFAWTPVAGYDTLEVSHFSRRSNGTITADETSLDPASTTWQSSVALDLTVETRFQVRYGKWEDGSLVPVSTPMDGADALEGWSYSTQLAATAASVFNTPAVPEPAALATSVAGALLGLGVWRRWAARRG